MDPNKDPNIELVPAPRRQSPARYPDQAYAPAPASYQQDEYEGPQSGLLDYWRIIRRRKGTIILIAFIGLVIGILVTLPQTPIFQARSSLEIQDINNDVTNLRSQSATNEMGSITNTTKPFLANKIAVC